MGNAIDFIRTNSDHPDFRNMVNVLDEDLNKRNGDIQRQYDQYNKIDQIKLAMVIYIEGDPVGCFKRVDDETIKMKSMTSTLEWKRAFAAGRN